MCHAIQNSDDTIKSIQAKDKIESPPKSEEGQEGRIQRVRRKEKLIRRRKKRRGKRRKNCFKDEGQKSTLPHRVIVTDMRLIPQMEKTCSTVLVSRVLQWEHWQLCGDLIWPLGMSSWSVFM